MSRAAVVLLSLEVRMDLPCSASAGTKEKKAAKQCQMLPGRAGGGRCEAGMVGTIGAIHKSPTVQLTHEVLAAQRHSRLVC